MEVNPILFWNGLLTLVIAPAIWVFRGMFMEVKRLDILLNKTREEYAKRDDVKEDMHTVMDALQRLEDKLDKILIGSVFILLGSPRVILLPLICLITPGSISLAAG